MIDPPGGVDPTRGSGAFAVPGLLVHSWYAVARSRQLRRAKPIGVDLGPYRLALWRDEQGVARAFNARCPHLGADLSQGRVDAGCLRCPFHGWSFDHNGTRSDGEPVRTAQTFSCCERYGAIWVHPDPDADASAMDCPERDAEGKAWILRSPTQRIRCHPHLVIANGLDIQHMDALHGLSLAGGTSWSLPAADQVRVDVHGHARQWLPRTLVGGGLATPGSATGVRARFETRGASLAWLTADVLGRRPLRFHVLFTARPDAQSDCVTQLIWFLPRRFSIAALRALLFTFVILHDDRSILTSLRFHRGFTEADAPLAAFARLVDTLPRCVNRTIL